MLLVAAAAVGVSAQQQAPPPTVSNFFNAFTAEWIRSNPNQAAATRYFSGAEQDAFEQQISPETPEFRHSRVVLAQKGLTELATFDRARMNEGDRVSADLMQWQLDLVVEGEKLQRLLLSARAVRRRERRPAEPARRQPSAQHREGRDALRRAARPREHAHGRGDCRRARARREEHDSAALHHPRDHRADAAVHRHAAGEEPVRDGVRSARRGVEGGLRRASARRAEPGGEDRRRAGLSRVEARHRAAAAARRPKRQTMRGCGGSRAAPRRTRTRCGGSRRRVSRPIRFTRSG